MNRQLKDHSRLFWKEIWVPLEKTAIRLGHSDLFCEICRGLFNSRALAGPPDIGQRTSMLNDPLAARAYIRRLKPIDYRSERHLLEFIEGAWEDCQELGGDKLCNRYFVLLERFLNCHGLKYDLRRSCSLSPTIPGLFASLVEKFASATQTQSHLNQQWREVEEAFRELRKDSSESKIKTVLCKQFNLLESVGQGYPGVTGNTFGQICNQIDSWPHDSLKDCAKNLYKFASDYPGIRHGGTPTSKLRDIDMREILGVSLALTAFTTYLTKLVDSQDVYGAHP